MSGAFPVASSPDMSPSPRPTRALLALLPLALLQVGCPITEEGVCPEPDPAFALHCFEKVVGCGVEPMVSGSLGTLNVSSEAVDVLVWPGGLLQIASDDVGGIQAQRFNGALTPEGPAVSLLPPVAGTRHAWLRAAPLRRGATVLVLEQETDTDALRLLLLRLSAGDDGEALERSGLQTLWEGVHVGTSIPDLELAVDPSERSLVIALGTAEGDGASRRLRLIRADLEASASPLVRDLPLPPAMQTRPVGVAMLDDGSVLLAGFEPDGEGGTQWVDQLSAGLEVEETLWAVAQVQRATSVSLLTAPDGETGTLGWFMPSDGDAFAELNRLERLVSGVAPEQTTIWLGPYFGPIQGGMIEQGLAYDAESLMQVSLELSPQAADDALLLGLLRMDVGSSSYNPWVARPYLHVPAADHGLRVRRNPLGGILASVPLLEDDGRHSLELFRICL